MLNSIKNWQPVQCVPDLSAYDSFMLSAYDSMNGWMDGIK